MINATSTELRGLTFELPRELEASAPPPTRDGVRLLVASPTAIEHRRFHQLAGSLKPGDLVVVNTSATLAAAIDGRRGDDTAVTVHFSTDLGDGRWVLEVRPRRRAVGPLTDAAAGQRFELDGGLGITLLAPYPPGQAAGRLWSVATSVEGGIPAYLARFGRPIRYAYVPGRFALAEYQTVFARRPQKPVGISTAASAEMPSAGRPFTAELVVDLVTSGIAIAPITLHTGVSSQDSGDPPLPEWFDVPAATARAVESTRRAGGRVVAVGTTVTRALESAVGPDGLIRARGGWTDLVLAPERPARVVSGLITGWHAPGASHLNLLQAVAGEPMVKRAYDEALRQRYLWHEFGDSCLLLPG